MSVNDDLVTVNGNQALLKDIVEYEWLVGCSVTAVAMLFGYWDRNGYDDLIAGDSSSYTNDVKQAIASAGHFNLYANPIDSSLGDAGYTGGIKTDFSQTGTSYHGSSIADFLLTSQSGEGLGFGWTNANNFEVGIHGYATYRGYDNFTSAIFDWGEFSFTNIAADIDRGRPVLLNVDSDGTGQLDHSVTVFGYDKASRKLLIHDGWAATEETRWIDYAGVKKGQPFGIGSVVFVNPGSADDNDKNLVTFYDDGAGSAAVTASSLTASGTVDYTILSADSGLGRTRTIEVASADGHTYYDLYDDGSGTAALYRVLAEGDGGFKWTLLSSDSGLSRATLGFATADARTFYQLYDDGSGTAALYRATLREDGTFAYTLLNSDSGLSRSSLALSTADGETFKNLVSDGSGWASLYEVTLRDDGTFEKRLLSAETFGSHTLGMAESDERRAPDPFAPDVFVSKGLSEVVYGSAGDNILIGTDARDVFIGSEGEDLIEGRGGDDQINYAGYASDYAFSRNADGSVAVAHAIEGTDTLKEVEGVWFHDEARWYALDSLVAPTPGGDATIHQASAWGGYLDGTGGADDFRGGGGNDTFHGMGGDDIYDGGGGDYNQVDLDGTAADYVFTREVDGTVLAVHARDGTDRLTDIDGIWFNGDGSWYALDSLVAPTPGGDGIIRASAWGGHLTGTDGADDFRGGGGNDTFRGMEGDDIYDGGGGNYNQVDLEGMRADYSWSRNADGSITATHAVFGTDILKDIQGVWFNGEESWASTEELILAA
jgi:hypothetical protein